MNETEKSELRKKLLLAGVAVAAFFILFEHILRALPQVPTFLANISGHIGTGAIVALIVGFSIDRLFHKSNLIDITSSVTKQIENDIPQVLAKMAAGKQLKYLNDSAQIYKEIIRKLQKYKYFTNTIISAGPTHKDPNRENYIHSKIDLINRGNLHCIELITDNVKGLVKHIKTRLDKEKASNYVVKSVNLQNPNTFINFCIFQNDLETADDAFLMIGWFANEQFIFNKDRCIATDHPDLIKMFISYFRILEQLPDNETIN